MGGWFIIDAMSAVKTKGYKVTCVTGVLAASMAFNILAACDERWSLPNAQLLWHPARIFTRRPVTADVMETWTEELKSINDKIKDLIIESSEMDEDFFDKHDQRETLHPAVNLVAHTNSTGLTASTTSRVLLLSSRYETPAMASALASRMSSTLMTVTWRL